MDMQVAALVAAGVIGGGVALIHGAIVQKIMVRPMGAALAGDRRVSPVSGRLLAPLLQFSTYNWLLGGLALIAAAFWMGPEARLVTGLLVGGSYLFGALGNLWATRGRHPGWALYALSLGLIGYGVVA